MGRGVMLVLVAVLVLAACGGDNSGDDLGGAASGTVTSDSSLASVTIAEGSLPDGTTLSDIEVEAVADLEDDRLPLVLVGLLPHGLQLSEPATVSIKLAGEPPAGFMVVHQSGSELEFLPSDVEFTDDGAVVSVSVSSFSSVAVYDVDAEGTITLQPSTVEKGQSQETSASFALSGIVEVYAGSWSVKDKVRFVRLSAPVDEPRDLDSEVSRTFAWSPQWKSLKVTASGTSFQTDTVSAACSYLNESDVKIDATVVYNADILEIGEPQAPGVADISRFFSPGEDVPTQPFSELGDVRHAELGDTVPVFTTVILKTPTSCVEPSGDESTTSSSAPPPAEEAISSFNLVGSAGDVTCEDPSNTLDPALTITGATFVQDGDEIVVTIVFEGGAEAYEKATTDKFPVAVQFRLKEGGPYPEAFFGDKGKLKVSGGLLQIVDHEFSDDTLTIRLKGRTLNDVEAVQVSTFVFAGGTCQHMLFSAGYND